MKHCLLVLAAVLALAIGVPASAQYMWLDVAGPSGGPPDGVCTSDDVLNSSIDSVHIYLSTNLNGDGSTAVCASGEDLTINSYTFVLSSVSGGVAYGEWVDKMGFGLAAGGPVSNSTDYFIGRASINILPPGTYYLGTMAVTVTGTPTLNIIAHSSVDGTSQTSFGSRCAGQDFNNTMRYGENQDQIPPGDWNDVCGTAGGVPVTETTWGQIKRNYSK